MKDKNCKEVFDYFKKHPRFPFSEWGGNYDDYTAMNLMLLNLVKSKMPDSQFEDYIFLKEYNNYRIEGDEGLFYPFGCVNHKRQQVLLIGIAKKNHESEGYASFSISTQKEDFYWEVFKDEFPNLENPFYYSTSIYFNPKYDESCVKLDSFMNCFFSENFDLEMLNKFNGSYFDGDFENFLNN